MNFIDITAANSSKTSKKTFFVPIKFPGVKILKDKRARQVTDFFFPLSFIFLFPSVQLKPADRAIVVVPGWAGYHNEASKEKMAEGDKWK